MRYSQPTIIPIPDSPHRPLHNRYWNPNYFPCHKTMIDCSCLYFEYTHAQQANWNLHIMVVIVIPPVTVIRFLLY